MDNKFVFGAVVVVAIIALGGLALPFAPDVVKERVVERINERTGALVSPDVYDPVRFHQGLTVGGRVVATSTSNTAETLLASDIMTTSGVLTTRIEVTPNAGNLTLTLPATSTMSYIAPNDGDMFTVVLENEATAATTTTIAAGAGMDLQEPDGQNVVIGQNNFAIVHFMRDEDTDFIVWVDESIPAD